MLHRFKQQGHLSKAVDEFVIDTIQCQASRSFESPDSTEHAMKNEIISTSVDEIGDFWATVVYPYAAPIVEANEGLEPDPIGSAVRVTFDAKEYLITAAHVIEGHLQGTRKERTQGAPYSYIPEYVEIEDEVVTAADPFDLAIVPLVSASRSGLRAPEHFALDVKEGEHCLFVEF